MKYVKIYDGVTIDMATSEIIETGKVSYVEAKDVTQFKGGSNTTTTTEGSSGFAKEYKPQISKLLGNTEALYDSGQLGAVAGLSPDQESSFAAGRDTAGRQTDLEMALANNANVTYADSAARQATDAALGRGNDLAGATGNLGGSRNAINQAQIHQAGQAQYRQEQAGLLQGALNAQGRGSATLGQVGAAQQQHSQNLADAPYKGLSQYASIFGSTAPKESKSTSTQPGGGK